MLNKTIIKSLTVVLLILCVGLAKNTIANASKSKTNTTEDFHVGVCTHFSQGKGIIDLNIRSMKNAGILEDDHVIIRKQEIANDGDIVAVTVEGETTLKRLKQSNGKTMLVPENRDYKEIDVTFASTVVHGVVVGLLRSYV